MKVFLLVGALRGLKFSVEPVPLAVTLAVGPANALLTVDSAAEPGSGSGLGIVSMRERAESIGGSCQAGPGGSGWLVDAVLPLAVSRRLEKGVT